MRPSGAKTWVEVSRSALLANARTLRRAVGGAKLMGVIKSNAYGHGLAATVGVVRGEYDWFGVDSLAEARMVRKATLKPVLILGMTLAENLESAVAEGYRVTVYDAATLSALGKIARGTRKAYVHLKIETGTSRQGLDQKDIPAFAAAAKRLPNVVIEGVSTHYANIEDTVDRSYAMLQLKRFVGALAQLRDLGIRPREAHTACSAAALLLPNTVFTMARTGVAMYGLWPSSGVRRAAERRGVRLRPALAWKTVVAQVKRLEKGSPISYGLTERVRRDSAVAVIPAGYWDGFDRGLSRVGAVIIRGRRAKVLGRVCMNMFVVDVTGIPGVRPESEVTLIGGANERALTADDMADAVGTINYEVVTRINPLLPRVVVR